MGINPFWIKWASHEKCVYSIYQNFQQTSDSVRILDWEFLIGSQTDESQQIMWPQAL